MRLVDGWLTQSCDAHRYEHGKLVEINSHSLFSKWFSESGKLVQRLFAQVTELVEEEGSFVVVLIGAYGEPFFCAETAREQTGNLDPDAVYPSWPPRVDEVESLTAARAGAMSGKEPSDALRVSLPSQGSCSTPEWLANVWARRATRLQVVNALLTQLDKLKHRKNCLVMTTSNLSEAIGELGAVQCAFAGVCG